MSSRFSVLARTAGLALRVSILCPLAHSQGALSRRPDLDGWQLTGASEVIRGDSVLALPAGAQISRVFGSGESITARVRFDAILSEEPEDFVSIQFGGSSLAFARLGDRGVVFAAESEREQVGEEALLTVALGPAGGEPVAVDLSALIGAAGSTVRIEVAAKTVELRTDGNGGDALEFAFSAGRSAPVRISAFEFVVKRPVDVVAAERAKPEATARSDRSVGSAPSDSARAADGASIIEDAHSAQSIVEEKAGARAAEPGGGRRPERPGLEVFTPPSVRRHEPNAKANPRASEVTP